MEKINVKKLIEDFEKDYKYLFDAGAKIMGVYGEMDNIDTEGELKMGISSGFEENDNVNPFKCHLSLMVDFFTDHRKLPKFYKGVKVQVAVRGDTEPAEFQFDDGTRDFIPLEEINMPQRYFCISLLFGSKNRLLISEYYSHIETPGCLCKKNCCILIKYSFFIRNKT